ncbi:MAG: hypothetical protein JXA87_03900 [Thermoleophilia bacterium]|nr:hypothetical protein [Thermoleophilia bacterium]
MRVKTDEKTKPKDPKEPEELPEVEPDLARPSTGPTLADRMALPEPRRTAELERAVESGEQFYLRSRSGKKITQRYGRHVLELTKEPKGFSAAHAIHLIWYLGDKVQEVDEV